MLLDPYRFAAPAGLTDPTEMFQSGEAGGWWDVQDLATLFEERVTPTTTPAIGDPVGTVLDKSGNANHLVSSADAARPILRQDGGGKYYLEFDGTDDRISAAFTISQPWHRFSVISQAGWTSGRAIFGGGGSTQSGLLQQVTSTPRVRFFDGSAGGEITIFTAATVLVAYERRGGTGNARARKNLEAMVSPSIPGTTAPGGFTVGCDRNTGTLFARVDFYGAIMRSGADSTDVGEDDVITYLGDLCGVTV